MTKSWARARIACAVAVLVVASPGLAWACAVCGAGRNEGSRQAFIWTTGLLSVLPPLMVGGLVWWLVRRARSLRASPPEPVLTEIRSPEADTAS